MAALISKVITLLWIPTSIPVGDSQLTCIRVCYNGLIHTDRGLIELKTV